MRSDIRKISVLQAFLLALGGCSAPSDMGQSQQQSPGRHVFSEEDKRVARTLSIGSEVENDGATPQFKATLCSLALEVIAGRLQNSDLMSTQQLQLFEKAQAHYRRQAAAGLSPGEREKNRNDAEASYPEQGDRARFAIGCLRDMA